MGFNLVMKPRDIFLLNRKTRAYLKKKSCNLQLFFVPPREFESRFKP
jgi:hypothetical protein